MKRSHFAVISVLAVVTLVAGCRTAPLVNIPDTPYAGSAPAAVLTLEDYEAAIIRAGASRDWTFERTGPGHLVGSVTVRGKHSAVVDVVFDTDSYSISYKSSYNLNYESSQNVIHPNYNAWVDNLKQEIDREIAALRAG